MNLNILKKEEAPAPADNFIYTEEQLMARLKFFIGICLALTLTGIVFVVLYSLIFVTQPLNAISPIDQKFFELIVPIATFLTGTLSGIMLAGGNKDLQEKALAAATAAPKPSAPLAPPPMSPAPTMGAMGSTFRPATPMGMNGPSPFGGMPSMAPAQSFQPAGPAPVAMSSSGKLMPMQEEHPEL